MRDTARNLTVTFVATAVAALTGCATPVVQPDPQIAEMQTRLQESERQNGRLSVRIEELEDQMFLMQDRVEANRLALQRRGMMRNTFDQDLGQAPTRTPETYYSTESYQAEEPRSNRRNVRIPLSGYDPYADPNSAIYNDREPQRVPERRQDQTLTNTQGGGQDDAEVIIDDETLRRFAGSDHVPAAHNTPVISGGRQAQPPVTSERLTPTNATASNLEAPKTTAQRAASRDSLTLYKDALSDYRAGKYTDAYTGFQSFLASKPSPDYVDNALYWLGECQFGMGNLDGSIGYFQRVMTETPDGNKVPDAMLKMSLAFERQGKVDSAKETLQKLISQYPTTHAGQLGTQKLNESR